MELKPQRGPQTKFLATSADIAIYGGAAGGGKSYGLLLDPLRHINVPGFNAIIFRKHYNQITAPGGLWETSVRMYSGIRGATSRAVPKMHWEFSRRSKLTFDHIARDGDVLAWQGSQICMIGFDELCHFSEYQFFYMLSRNRSVCGVRPYIRATCNPDADSWVADFISWWIDPGTGYAVPERSGKVRYFFRSEGRLIWGDSLSELANKCRGIPDFQPAFCKSVTFIASSVYDNKILLHADPGYISNLYGMNIVERERLLKGNWLIKPAAGLYFSRRDVTIVDHVPDKIVAIARAWDLAATEITTENKNPDRTAGALVARLRSGQYIVLDVVRKAFNSAMVRKLIRNTGLSDKAKYNCNHIYIPQDPGQAGKEQAASYVSYLAGFIVKTKVVSKNKVTRAEPFSAQWQQGNVLLLAGAWNDEFLREMEGFPEALHDDQVDAVSDAFKAVAVSHNWHGLIS